MIRTLIASMFASLLALSASVALAADAPKETKLATCNDGKVMYSTTGKHAGACRGHGGVKEWADGSPVRAPKGKGAVRYE
jgi:TRAP-type uncharacterized transport system substrate-binding protein